MSLISGVAMLGQGLTNLVGGIKKNNIAKGYERSGKRLEKKAWAGRNDYGTGEVEDFYNLSANNVNAKSGLQSALENEANVGAASMLSSIERNATSGNNAILAASMAEDNRQDSMRDAIIAGAQERDRRIGQLGQATNMLTDENRYQWQKNVGDVFDTKYNKAMGLQGAGMQGRLKAIDQSMTGINTAIAGGGEIAEGIQMNKLYGAGAGLW